MIERRSEILIITSPNAGLAHYVVHLWRHILPWANPTLVTHRIGKLDDLVLQHIPTPLRLVDENDETSVARIANLVETRNIKIVNLHVASTVRLQLAYFVRVLRAVRAGGARVILTLHDVLPYANIEVDAADMNALFAQADALLVGNSSEQRRLMAFDFSSDIPVAKVPHGPYDLLVRKTYTIYSARKKLRIPNETRIVLCFGSWRPDKGFETLIDAHRMVREQYTDVLLYMHTWHRHGDLANFKQLSFRARSEVGVKFSSKYIPAPEVELVFSAADLVVLPYTRVSQSGILHLARAMQKPVVVSDAFHEADKLEPWPGRVAVADSASSLAKAITGLLSITPAVLQVQAAQGWRRVFSNDGWEENASGLRSMIDRISCADKRTAYISAGSDQIG